MNLEPVIYKIDFINDKNLINISDNENYFLSHKILFSSFLDIEGFLMASKVLTFKLRNDTSNIQQKLEKLQNNIRVLDINSQYYELEGIKLDVDINQIKNLYGNIIIKYETLIRNIMENEDQRNIANKKIEIENEIDNILEKYAISLHFNIYEDKRLRQIYIDSNDILTLLNN